MVKPVTMTLSSVISMEKSHWCRVVMPTRAFSSKFSCTEESRNSSCAVECRAVNEPSRQMPSISFKNLFNNMTQC